MNNKKPEMNVNDIFQMDYDDYIVINKKTNEVLPMAAIMNALFVSKKLAEVLTQYHKEKEKEDAEKQEVIDILK